MPETDNWMSFYEYIELYVDYYNKTKKIQKFTLNGVSLVVDGTLTTEELSDYYLKNVDLDKVWR